MAVQQLRLPYADHAARMPSGAWVLTDSTGVYPNASPIVLVQDGSGWIRHALPTTADIFEPGAISDRSGVVHVMYKDLESPFSGPSPVVHEWLETGTWHREVVATRDFSWPLSTFSETGRVVVGGDGALHALWASPGDWEYATSRGGAWVVEPMASVLPLPYPLYWSQIRIAAGPDGVPWVLLVGTGRLALAWKESGGWAAEQVPFSAPLPSTEEEASGLFQVFRAAGRTTLVLQPIASVAPTDLWVLDRDASGWKAPTHVGSTQLELARGYPGRALASASDDGARLAVAWEGPGASARVRANGWTDFRIYTDGAVGGPPLAGFTPDAKLWVLAGLGNTEIQVLFSEP
jgi:hypothetical protein